MGNDGGSIPTRRELVKNAARNPNLSELKATQIEALTYAWTYCPLSQRPLADPIVSDSGGTLYNKDAIIEHLLPSPDDQPKDNKEEILKGRVKGMRDVVEVLFRLEKDEASKSEKRICPLTSKELGPHNKAVYIVPCGHAFSEAALKEVSDTTCLECGKEYNRADDIIPILPTSKEDIARLTARAVRLKEAGLTHSLKKEPGSKKKKKNKGGDTDATGVTSNGANGTTDISKTSSGTATPTLAQENVKSSTKRERSPLRGNSTINNAATASLTARVLEEQEERNKRRKMGLNDNLRSLFANNNEKGVKKSNNDFMTRGFSVPK